MLVPRSYKYTRSSVDDAQNEKDPGRKVKRVGMHNRPRTESDGEQGRVPGNMSPLPLRSPFEAPAAPMSMPSKPLSIPERPHRPKEQPRARTEPHISESRGLRPHNPMPFSVAELLAITAIPPPRKTQIRKGKPNSRRISIDELVQEWRQEASNNAAPGSHKSMGVLLEIVDSDSVGEEALCTTEDSCHLIGSRTTSSDSIPSLSCDEQSLLSQSSPSTPEAFRVSRSGSFAGKKSRPRALPIVEDCGLDHPLGLPSPVDDDFAHFIDSPLSARSGDVGRRKSSFKSNLTLSLQTLKTRALSSLQQLNLNTTIQSPTSSMSSMSDAALWQHPFIFPRLSSEIRPSYSGAPSESQRRYFNPSPLNFDEQQGVYRQALHSTLLLDTDDSVPMIQMQTYERARPRKSRRKGGATTEAGRALNGPPLMRQREPRENGDFLRVVVLEMNMRREGKFEEGMGGRARIWLPPRRMSSADNEEIEEGRVPKRWVGVTLDD